MPRGQFVAKLDDSCKRSNAAAKPIETDLAGAYKAHDFTENASLLERLLAVEAPLVAERAKLTPPADLEGAFARYKSATEQLQTITLHTIAALKAHDAVVLKTLRGLETSESDTRAKAAIDLGAKSCGAQA
jgi:hypothetical protein